MQLFKKLRIADGGILILMTVFNVEEHPLKLKTQWTVLSSHSTLIGLR